MNRSQCSRQKKKRSQAVKAGRSEPISVNGTHNDPIEREIVSLVSWYRIIKSWKEGDSSFFHCRIRCCRGTASTIEIWYRPVRSVCFSCFEIWYRPGIYILYTRFFTHALLEKIFHLSLLEKLLLVLLPSLIPTSAGPTGQSG